MSDLLISKQVQGASIIELDKKIMSAVEKELWDEVKNFEEQREREIRQLFTDLKLNEQTPELISLIQDLLCSTKVLQEKIQQQQQRLGKKISGLNYGYKMHKSYQDVISSNNTSF